MAHLEDIAADDWIIWLGGEPHGEAEPVVHGRSWSA